MSAETFNQRIESLWAQHFGCPVEEFQREGTTLLPRERLQGQSMIHVVYIHRHALAEIDPGLQTRLSEALAGVGENAVLSSELLGRLWGGGRIAEVDAGLVFHLRPGKLVRPDLDLQYTLRRLTPEDAAGLEALRKRCTEAELEDAFVELNHEIGWGCFKGSQMAAVGSGYRRNGFMDFGVLTGPKFRGQGLARHVVVGLSDDTLALDLIPQYRCNRVNQPSRRVAEAAGFTLFFTTESVKLAG